MDAAQRAREVRKASPDYDPNSRYTVKECVGCGKKERRPSIGLCSECATLLHEARENKRVDDFYKELRPYHMDRLSGRFVDFRGISQSPGQVKINEERDSTNLSNEIENILMRVAPTKKEGYYVPGGAENTVFGFPNTYGCHTTVLLHPGIIEPLRRFNMVLDKALQQTYDRGYNDHGGLVLGIARGTVSMEEMNKVNAVMDKREKQ